MVVLSRNAVNAVLYLIMSLFSVSLIFYALGGPFVAVLEVIIYAGAIVVLFLFVVMMLIPSAKASGSGIHRPTGMQMLLPAAFAVVLLVETCACLFGSQPGAVSGVVITPAEIGRALYEKHYLGVELASLVLLIGLIGGMHIGRASSEPDTVEKSIDAAR
jgi:NADH-quinone oxidoreductase subunit J